MGNRVYWLSLAGLMLLGPSGMACADEQTVTLTASELQAVINAEISRAQAASALGKIQQAFAPPKAEVQTQPVPPIVMPSKRAPPSLDATPVE